MSSLSDPITVFSLMLVASAVPGPSDVLVVVAALRGGWRGAFRVVAGILCGDMLLITLAALGWMSVEVWLPGLGRVLRIGGLVFVFVLSLRGLGAGPDSGEVPAASLGYRTGFLVTLADPTAIGFYAAVLPLLTGGGPVRVQDALLLLVCAATAIVLVKFTTAWLTVRLNRTPFSPSVRCKTRRTLCAILALTSLGLFVQTLKGAF